MYPIEQVRTNQGKPFEIYTPFYRRAIRIPVPEPHSIPCFKNENGFLKTSIDFEVLNDDLQKYYTFNEYLVLKGGRTQALQILENMKAGGFRKYKKDHEFPIKDGTTKLSAYLKFGCVSIREVFKIAKEALGKAHIFIGQLYMKEFYYTVAYHFPEILRGQVADKSTPMHWTL
jgi:deoxyribodipyrimidine photo-lyase